MLRKSFRLVPALSAAGARSVAPSYVPIATASHRSMMHWASRYNTSQLVSRNGASAASAAVWSRNMFIQIKTTPNPNSLMFEPGTTVLNSGTATFTEKDDLRRSPLARALLRLDGVTGVFFAGDFITVTRVDGEDWDVIKPDVFATIMDFFSSGQPVMTESEEDVKREAGGDEDEEVDEVVEMIEELLETRIRPHVQADGGDITFVAFDEGIVTLKMEGACASCPSSTATLHGGVERMLQHYIPEVVGVVQSQEDDFGLLQPSRY